MREIGLYILFSVALLVGCNDQKQGYISLQGAMLGTTYHITAELHPQQREELADAVAQLNERMIREMSLFDPASQLSRINRGESRELTPWLEQNIRLADSISRLSGGVYDITVAPLVKAWGFAAERREESPNIDSLLQFVGYEGLSVTRGEIAKRDERMQIDLNSIAKGFAVDRMADLVEEYGAVSYMVEIGGELRVRGVNPSGEGWRIGIESPIDGNMSDGEYLELRIRLESGGELRGVATSGNYRRYYLNERGEKIVHTIDPKTGRSRSSTLLSATVLAPTCAEADAYATMLMAAGDSRAEELAEEIDRCEVYLIYSNEDGGYREWLSPEMQSRVIESK